MKRYAWLPVSLFLLSVALPATAANYYIARSGQNATYFTSSSGYAVSYGSSGWASSSLQAGNPAPLPAPEPAPAPPPAPKSPSGTGSVRYHVATPGNISIPGTTGQTAAPPAAPAPAPSPAPQPSPPASGYKTPVVSHQAKVTLTAEERLLLNLVNSERQKAGLPLLQVDSRLTQLARLKSRDMIALNYFSHLSPTYGRSGDMLKNAGISFYLAAENIGIGGSVRSIFNAFMASGGHRSKIMDSRYRYTGIGILYQKGRGYVVTQLFLAPK